MECASHAKSGFDFKKKIQNMWRSERNCGQKSHCALCRSILGWFSVGRFDYNGAKKSHDLLKFNSSHWLKLQHSDWRANLVKDFFYK